MTRVARPVVPKKGTTFTAAQRVGRIKVGQSCRVVDIARQNGAHGVRTVIVGFVPYPNVPRRGRLVPDTAYERLSMADFRIISTPKKGSRHGTAIRK